MDELRTDPVIADLVAEFGPLELTPAENEFERLVVSIVNQQLSTASARAIKERLFERFDGPITPKGVLAVDEAVLAETGLGATKAEYVRNAATAFQERDLTRAGLAGYTDEEVIAELSRIRGVGEWTARMYLIFVLGREDVFPIGDLAVRRGMEELYGEMTREEMVSKAEAWQPYRSIATLYIWEYYES